MTRFYYDRERVKKQVVQNLIDAGTESQATAEDKMAELGGLDAKDLLVVLLE